ncbi:hypothetical protein HQ865_20445 [Mucilaginibacter mali]|uniref:Lipoprotein n=1 Tax=Mucilaginibacter mali TaxID=2740462 RepID=A0A7D4QHJ7_9SPHI|nr:hypothetical protein [Mucilaginibacter mali]QKJ32032.1 hypothetical protein HQ865_20445 [Mucilaginibacter mali]
MKTSSKITLALLAVTVMLSVSCKKNETTTTGSKTFTAAQAKQVAMGLYSSLGSGVGASGNGLKTNSGTLKTMDDQHPCGSVMTTPTNQTSTSNGVTTTYIGTRVFTYLCNGYYNNNWNVDAYNIKDTTTKTETGAGFKNYYTVGLTYDVKATDANYTQLSVLGLTNTVVYSSKVDGNNNTTEWHKYSTAYNWNEGVTAIRYPDNSQVPSYTSGKVKFVMTIVDVVGDNNPGQTPTNVFTGFITFIPDNKGTLSIYTGNGSETKDFSVNFLTGEVKAL